MKSWLCAALVVTAAVARGDQFAQSTPAVGVWDRVEWTLTLDDAPAGNPFIDATLTAEVTPPGGGAPIAVEGFCDSEDGRVYRLRFLPTVAGEHAARLEFRAGDKSLSHDAKLAVKPSRKPGIVGVDPENPWNFRHRGNGREFFWNSTTTYYLMGIVDEQEIQKTLDRLGRLGVNRLRVTLCGRTESGKRWNEPLAVASESFRYRCEPWPAARPDSVEDPSFDTSRYNLEHYRRVERMLDYANRRGIQVSLIFFLDGADKGAVPFPKAPTAAESAAEERYYRYTVARLGAMPNVMWDVTNEWELFRTKEWVEARGSLLDKTDPYGHLIGVHGHYTFEFRESPWCDYATYQSWDEGGGYDFMIHNRALQTEAGRPIPQVNEEYGYEDHYPYPWGGKRRWPARTADTRRRLAWEMTMAGAHQSTGERVAGPGAEGWITGRGDDRMTMLRGYRPMRDFFESIPRAGLEPRPDLLRVEALTTLGDDDGETVRTLREAPMCLAEEGVRYVVYLPRGGDATLTIPAAASWNTIWLNPRTGEMADAGLFQSKAAAGGTVAWRSPKADDALDWVLLLERLDVP
jgi:hypothetical protein